VYTTTVSFDKLNSSSVLAQWFVWLEGVTEIGRYDHFSGVMFVVQRAKERHMRFEKADIQNEGLMMMTPEELTCLRFQELGFTVLDGEASCEASAEPIVFAGSIPSFHKEMMIAAPPIPITPLAVVLCVAILDGHHLCKAVLWKDLIAEMPLAHVGRSVPRIFD
jgi:hypothetical protein